MTGRPRISFVVPAFNEEAYIRRSLLSIRREIRLAGCDAQVIVVNNASTDATRELAASFAGVIVIDEPVRGLVQARSAGSRAATGGSLPTSTPTRSCPRAGSPRCWASSPATAGWRR